MQLLNIITQLEQSRLSYTIYFIILFFFSVIWNGIVSLFRTCSITPKLHTLLERFQEYIYMYILSLVSRSQRRLPMNYKSLLTFDLTRVKKINFLFSHVQYSLFYSRLWHSVNFKIWNSQMQRNHWCLIHVYALSLSLSLYLFITIYKFLASTSCVYRSILLAVSAKYMIFSYNWISSFFYYGSLIILCPKEGKAKLNVARWKIRAMYISECSVFFFHSSKGFKN